MTDADNDKFLKGILATMGIVIAIMAAWGVYTQSNRFTYRDALRHEERMDKIELVDISIEEKYDAIHKQLIQIETLIRYKLVEQFQDKDIIGRKFTEGEKKRVSP